ncbi:alpha/beta fold hydrolase [Streptomyces sp. NPDC058439]|uniref:alpha/beta fold hydrolase n=1 Tax=Streptomyces sp. NPDC058439 TaxID=3346500 RepID=UPI0036688C67
MVTVLFVHGTGVREPSYTQALEGIRNGLARVRPDVRVEPCDWGSALGSYLRAGGVSIPGYPEYLATAEGAGAETAESGVVAAGPYPSLSDGFEGGSETDEDRLRWAMLYADPFAELGVYAMSGKPPGSGPPALFTPGVISSGDQLLELLSQLRASDAVRGAWRAFVSSPSAAEGVAALLAAPELRRAVVAAPAEADALPRLAARALTAWAIAQSPRGAGAFPVPERDDLVDLLTNELGGDAKGLNDVLVSALGYSARLFERSFGSRMLVARRARLSNRSVGFFGDVLSYLTRGQSVRDHVADTIRALPDPGPVILLGHSLGGIIAFDLLAAQASNPVADMLVTVGSQAPLLYELDALPSLPYGTGLPGAFPRWLNIYDRRDLLSYVAAEAFGNDPRITDVAVDNRQPVSAAHSSYWANAHLYQALADALPG